MHPSKPRPAFDRISSLTALILLTYGLVRMMTLPSVEADVALFGLLVHIEFKPQTLMLLLAAGLAAAGSEWLIRSDAQRAANKPTFEHWVIPSFAAVAIGFILTRIPRGPQMWIGLVMGGFLLIAVLTAEFIVARRDDPRRDQIVVALRGLSFLLLTGSFFAVSYTQLRAIFAIPIVSLIAALTSWRLLRLSFPDFQVWTWAVVVGLVGAQFAIGIHYLPLSPLLNSVVLAMVTYVVYGLIHINMEGKIAWTDIIESILLVLLSLAILVYFG